MEIKSLLRIMGLCLLATAVAGCGKRRFTDTPRTASEQLLIAAAVDRAAEQLDFAPLEERKVFIDDKLIDRIDKTFVQASIRQRAFQGGAMVVDTAEEADYILELRSGAVGVDRDEYILGIPASELPTPFGGAYIPETALFKSVDQAGASRLSFIVYRRDDRRLFYASGPAYGFSNQKNWWILGAGPVVNQNIKPEPSKANTTKAPRALGQTPDPVPEELPEGQ
ncbi:MAG: DUF6655 family protein [Phycisphaerae bacterium]